MTEISKERVGLLFRTALDIVAGEPDGLKAAEVIKRVAGRLTLTEHELGEYPTGGRRFDIMLRFKTVGAVKAGWLIKAKGRWVLTEEGRTALKKFPDGADLYDESVRLYRIWRRATVDDAPDLDVDEQAGEEPDTTVTYEQAEEQAWADISSHVQKMPPYELQELVASLLRAMGYYVSWVAPPGKDGGIDILAATDPLGTRPPRIKVQVKRQLQNISVDILRSFMAVLGDQDVGLFVTTSSFTKDAKDEARAQERRRITLIDLELLVDLWVEHYGKLDETAKRRLPLKPIYFLAPEV